MLHKTTQLSVMAVAVLAIVAVVAVALFAANGAQAENVTTNALPHESGNGGNQQVFPPPEPTAEPTPEPTRQSQPEPCADPPVHAITGGAHALFESYWDYEDENLVNNPCPPAVEHIVEPVDIGGGQTEDQVVGTGRKASKINIESTVIHMPAGLRLQVVEKPQRQRPDATPVPGTYPVAKNSALFEAYPADETNKYVWLLPEWEPETPADEVNEENELIHIGFSAALLDQADWNGEIKWNFETVREPGFTPEDRGVFLVTADPNFQDIDWDSRNPDVQRVSVVPGEYEHRTWAFTKPGTYVLRVHAKGTPSKDNSLGRENTPVASKSVTSDISHYTFHVGSLADLNVAVSADTETPEAGGVVTYTVDAANAGPDTAPHGEVTVSLPEGLTYDPVDTRVNTAAPADGAVTLSADGRTLTWQVGEMVDDYSARLSFKARVGADTADQALEVTANIVARETIGHSEVAQLDPRDRDDSSTATVTPTGTPNGTPLFTLEWSVEENADAGTVVGRVKTVDPDGDVLFYNLKGEGYQSFDVALTDDGVEVRVSALASLDHEAGPQSYNMVLTVTDNKGPDGEVNGDTDDTIGITIAVTDVVDEASDLAFSVDKAELAIGETTTFTLDTLAALPEGASEDTVHITGPSGSGESHTVSNVTSFPVTWELTGSGDPGSREYNASLSFTLDNDRVHISADPVTVNWTAAE